MFYQFKYPTKRSASYKVHQRVFQRLSGCKRSNTALQTSCARSPKELCPSRFRSGTRAFLIAIVFVIHSQCIFFGRVLSKPRRQQKVKNSDQNTMKWVSVTVCLKIRSSNMFLRPNCRDKKSKLIDMGRIVIVVVVSVICVNGTCFVLVQILFVLYWSCSGAHQKRFC